MKTILRRYYQPHQPINYRIEILAGLTVAMTMIPESLSFAIIAGLPPLTGLYAAFIMGLVTAVLGGRPGMVSGGAGATAIVLVALMQAHGLEYVFAAVLLAGLMQTAVGFFRLAKFIRLVPQPVMYGFVNGLAIIIFLSQVAQFKTNTGAWLAGSPLYTMLGLAALTVLLVWGLPKITKKIPASLLAIVVVFAVVRLAGIDTKTVRDIAAVGGGFPPFHLPSVPFSWHTLEVVFPYALIMAGVGLVESLLTLNLVDEMVGNRGSGNREAVAQGAGNILNGLFTGMGGCAMIAQTFVNLAAGARARLSGIVAALAILAVILVASPLIEELPMAALVGVMAMVALGTFEWASLKMINKMPRHDVVTGILVAAITVWLHNLALAVLVGVVISALVFAWESARRIRARIYTDEAGVRHYELYGPLFFGSITAFHELFNVASDPATVVIDFRESRVMDMSAIEALHKLTERYQKGGKELHLRHLSADCRRLLLNASGIIDVNILDDPSYHVAHESWPVRP